MKSTMKRILAELLKDSSRSDRELAKILGVSQPTVSRLRNRLVENGMIRLFTVIPDFNALGFELLAITSFMYREKEGISERAKKWTTSKPNVLFAAPATGKGRNAVMISLHKNYADYQNFISEVKREGQDDVRDYDSLLVSLEGHITKPFSLKYLAKLVETSKDQL